MKNKNVFFFFFDLSEGMENCKKSGKNQGKVREFRGGWQVTTLEILMIEILGYLSELQIIFTVVSVFTKENFNPFSNLISPFGIGTHEIQWLFSIFLTHNWSPIYLLL